MEWQRLESPRGAEQYKNDEERELLVAWAAANEWQRTEYHGEDEIHPCQRRRQLTGEDMVSGETPNHKQATQCDRV
jgi:hypothetical protein